MVEHADPEPVVASARQVAPGVAPRAKPVLHVAHLSALAPVPHVAQAEPEEPVVQIVGLTEEPNTTCTHHTNKLFNILKTHSTAQRTSASGRRRRGQVIARVARRAVSCIGARPTGGALRGGGANGSLGEAHCARGRAQCKASVARRAKRRIGAGTDGGTRRSRGASCSPRWEQNTKNKAEYSVQLRVE